MHGRSALRWARCMETRQERGVFVIEIRNVEKRYGATTVLEGVDITIPDGSIFGLVGISGAGKSTLLRCINGLETFDNGDLVVDGTDVSTLSRRELRAFRKDVGMIFQQFSLLERKTVHDNVALPMKCHGVAKAERDKRVAELLDLVGLADKAKAKPRELSGGQKQRVAIARALTLNPKVLLCDEATSALDPNITRSILDLLREINRELGITIVVVTHQMEVVKRICDKVAILERGVVTYTGTVEDLFLYHPDAIETVTGAAQARDAAPDEATYKVVQHQADESLLSRIAIGTGIDFNVVWGGLDTYRTSVAGSFILRIPRAQKAAFERFLESEKGIEWEVVDGRGKAA